jgi:hypothetical protein
LDFNTEKIRCPCCGSTNIRCFLKGFGLSPGQDEEVRVVTDCRDCGKKRARVTEDFETILFMKTILGVPL